MHHSFARVGGLKDDLPRGFIKRAARGGAPRSAAWCRNTSSLIMGNEIVFARCRDVGSMSQELAIAYGCSGPVAQAAGVAMDPRKDEPYEKYGEVEFDVPVGNERRLLRPPVGAGRAREGVLQHHRAVPGQAYRPGRSERAACPRRIKIPEGEIYVRQENPLGIMGYYVVGDGKKEPYRLKMRTASFSNICGAAGDAARHPHPRPDLDPRLDLLRRRRRRQVAGRSARLSLGA